MKPSFAWRTGLIALKDMSLRLGEDHANAQVIAQQLATCQHIAIEPASVCSSISASCHLQIQDPGFSGHLHAHAGLQRVHLAAFLLFLSAQHSSWSGISILCCIGITY